MNEALRWVLRKWVSSIWVVEEERERVGRGVRAVSDGGGGGGGMTAELGSWIGEGGAGRWRCGGLGTVLGSFLNIISVTQ